MTRYQIAVDAMGGDHAPSSVVDGVKLALAEMNDIEIRLCGPASALDACRDDRVHPVEANEVITMEEAPMLAVRKKTDSSLVKAMLEVREGRAQAVVSAGSTGAVLAAMDNIMLISVADTPPSGRKNLKPLREQGWCEAVTMMEASASKPSVSRLIYMAGVVHMP